MPETKAIGGRAATIFAVACLVGCLAGAWPGIAVAQAAADDERTTVEEVADPPDAAEPDSVKPVGKVEKEPPTDRPDDEETMSEEPAVSVDSATSPDSPVGRKKVAKRHSQPAAPLPHGGPCEPRPNQIIPPCITFEEFKKLQQDPAWQAKRDGILARERGKIPSSCATPDEHGGTAAECLKVTPEQVAAVKKREEAGNLAYLRSCRQSCVANHPCHIYGCPKKKQECFDVCQSKHAEDEHMRHDYDAYLDGLVR